MWKTLRPLSDIATIYSHIFFYILTAFIISQYSVQWVRQHFATFMCNINYKFIYYFNLPFSYYSQFTVIIFFYISVTGYIRLLCITITWIYSSIMFACWLRLNLMLVWRDIWLMYDLYYVSIIMLVIVHIYLAWYIWVDLILWFRLTFLRYLALIILRRPMLLTFLVWRLKFCVICFALFVRSWRRLLAAEI